MSNQTAVTPAAQKAAEAASSGAKAQASSSTSKGKGGAPQGSYFSVLFYLLVDAMEIRQGTVLTQSKVIKANSSAQNELNERNANIKFSYIPYGADNSEINRVQDNNQQYAAMRDDIQSALITARQSGQVEMTQASTNVNILEQDASEDSKWVGTLNTIFQVIDKMTGR